MSTSRGDAMDELASGRQLRADLRELKRQYPELTTPYAQARLDAYLRTQVKEPTMPAKDDRLFGEDLVVVTARIPQSASDFIDQHLARLRLRHEYRHMKLARSDAMRDLILSAIDAIEQAEASTAVVEASEPPAVTQTRTTKPATKPTTKKQPARAKRGS